MGNLGGRLVWMGLVGLALFFCSFVGVSSKEAESELDFGLRRSSAVGAQASSCVGQNNGMVLVSMLDGSLHAYNAENGNRMWSVHFPKPSATSWSREDWPEVVAGVDGNIYFYDEDKEEVQPVDQLHSPVGSKPSVLLSYRETKAFYVDRCTGKVLRALSYADNDFLSEESCPDAEQRKSLDDILDKSSEVVILRSVESGMRVIEPATGMQVMNASIHHIKPLLFQNGECLPSYSVDATHRSAEKEPVYRLEVSHSRKEIHMFNGDSTLWSETLPSLAIEAHGLNGVEVEISEQAEALGLEAQSSTNLVPRILAEDEGRSRMLVGPKTISSGTEKAEYFESPPDDRQRYLPGPAQQSGNYRRSTRSGLKEGPSWIEILIAVLFCGTLIVSLLLLYRTGTRKEGAHFLSTPMGVDSGTTAKGSNILKGVAGDSSSGSVELNETPNKKKKKKKKKAKHADEVQGTAASPGKPMVGGYGQVPEGFFGVGRIWVSQKVLGVGSNGTIVYEGKLQPGDRPIAVKRLLRYLYDSASKEIQMLISLDESTQNVVRYFAMEEDHEYIYLALELCAGTLAERVAVKEHPALREKDIGDSIPWATIAALNDLIQGVKNLHMFGVVHRDLKPQNVLLTRRNAKTNDVQVKLGDVGLATKLEGDRSSYSVMTGVGAVGTVGWRAPEVLRGDRQTKAVDIFSAGCVVHYVLSGGHHPFGDRPYERDLKIMKWEVDLSRLECFPEAHDLVSRMVVYDAGSRASADQIQHHPLFWTDSRKVAFLCDIADKLQDPRLGLMERINAEDGAEAFLDWQLKLDMTFLKNLNTRNVKTQRVYENNAAGLLRVMRNKRSHYSELGEDVQNILGPMPVEGVEDPRKNYYRYFSDRFPKLFMFVYRFARNTRGIYTDPQFSCYNFHDTYMQATVEEQVEEIAELERRVSLKVGKGALKGVSSTRQKVETQPRVVRNFDEMIVYGFERNHPKPNEKVLRKLNELRIYDPGVKARWRSMTKQVSNERQSAAQKYAFPAHRIVLKQDRVN